MKQANTNGRYLITKCFYRSIFHTVGVFVGYSRGIRGVFMGYTYVSGMCRVCIGYVSGMYRRG